MVAKRSDEGDLFPRSNGPNSTPRIKKRDGQVLFGPESKRSRKSRSLETEYVPNNAATQFGAALSFSRLTPGMTVLGYVVKANHRTVEFALSSGIRATCIDDTLLEDELLSRISVPDFKKTSDADVEETDAGHSSDDGSDSDESMSDDGSGSDEDVQSRVRPVWEVLSVGSVLPVAIVDVGRNSAGTITVSVSLKPHLINAGLNPMHLLKKAFPAFAAILSVEDHGYVLSFGSNIPYTAFLPFERCDEVSHEKRLSPGTPVQVITVRDSATRSKKQRLSVPTAVQVSARASDVFSKAVGTLDSATIQDLRAGMALRARVMREGPGGLVLLFMGVFNISVDAAHLPCDSDGNRSVSVDSQVTVRLLCVDAASKTLLGTLLPEIVKTQRPRPIPARWKIGTLLKPVVVEMVRPRHGLILHCSDNLARSDAGEQPQQLLTTKEADLPDDEKQKMTAVPLIAHISKVSDSKGIDLEEKFRVGTVIEDGARVTSISRMDGVANVDLRASVLSRKALSIDEIEPGCVYDCKVLSHTSFGSVLVAVDGDPNLAGMIRSNHISDVPITVQKLSKHESFRIGGVLKCLVLSVDIDRGRVYLTARKSLIFPKYPILTSLEDVAEQLKASEDGDLVPKAPQYTGTVLCATEKCNLLIGFCNGLAGLVPQSEMCLDITNRSFSYKKDEIETVYPPGQTIVVRVTEVHPQAVKLYLSLNLQIPDRNDGGDENQLGKIVDVKVIGVDTSSRHFITLAPRHINLNANGTAGRRLNGEGSVDKSLASSNSVEFDEKIECHLPYGHLSDFPAMSERLAAVFEKRLKGKKNSRKNFILRSAMVLCYREDVAILTLKDSLKSASVSGRFPSTFEEVKQLVQEGDNRKLILQGYVKALASVGVIVGFQGNVVGFVRKSRIADSFISDASRVLKIDQSLAVKIESIDLEKRRFDLSSRQCDVGMNATYQTAKHFISSLKYWSHFMGTSGLEDEYPIGAVTKATLDSILPYGAQYHLGSQATVTGVVLDIDSDVFDIVESTSQVREPKKPNRSEKTRKVASDDMGAIHEVRVLDIDPISGVVDLSREKELVESGRKVGALSPEKSYEGRVLLVKGTHIVVAVRKTKTQTVIACSPPPSVADALVVRPGAVVTCKAFDHDPDSSRILVIIDWEAFRGVSKGKPLHRGEDHPAMPHAPVSILRRAASEDPSGVKGMILSGRVTRRFNYFSYLGIGHGVVGHLHSLNVGTLSPEESKSIPLGRLNGDLQGRFLLPEVETYIPQCFVVGIRKSPDSGESSPLVVEVALKKERCEPAEPKAGRRLVGIVKTLSPRVSTNENVDTKSQTVISLGPSHMALCHDVDCLGIEGFVHVGVNDAVMCLVTEVDSESPGRARVCISENGNADGSFFSGLVESVNPGFGIRVKIPWLARDADAKTVTWGTVNICDMGVDFDEVNGLIKTLEPGSIVRVRKVSDRSNEKRLERPRVLLTMRNESDGIVDPTICPENARLLKPGTPLRGFVRAVGNIGCFVTVGRDVVAHVKKSEMSDNFIKDPAAEFPVGTLVSGKVTEIQEKQGEVRVCLTFKLRQRATLQDSKALKVGMEEGHIVIGTVKRVGKFGVTLEFKPGVTGFLHISNADQDRYIERPFEEWVLGQKLKCVVTNVENGKILLGTKRCYFEAAGVEEENVDHILIQNERWKSDLSSDPYHQSSEVVGSLDPNVTEIVDGEDTDSDGSSDVVFENCISNSVVIHEDHNEDEYADEHKDLDEDTKNKVPPLVVPQGFDFGGRGDSRDQGSIRADEDNVEDIVKDEVGRNRSSRDKRDKKRTKQAEELEIRLREEALARGDDVMETAEDYERMVTGEPNSSVMWIRYIAFCVELSQIEKARTVAERALETIAMEKETERTNVWVAYINMEAHFGNMYGTNDRKIEKESENADDGGERDRILREAAVMRVFDRACERVTDVEKLHLTVANALRECDVHLAGEILKRATRKFKTSEKVWLAMGEAHFSSGNLELGRQCLERALLSVEKRKHVNLISKFAQFEYKMGSPERGRTVFESLVGNLKKCVDVWNVYLDMEIGLCKKNNMDTEAIVRTRQIFARFAALNLSSKKMKFAFKKWLEFEKTFGEKSDQKKVKQLAREYVERSVRAE